LVGTTSASQAVTLTNTGGADLVITSIVASSGYAGGGDCPTSPSVLAPGLFCTINITFSPTLTGDDLGTITITDNAYFTPQTISLDGTGFAPVPQISLPLLPASAAQAAATSP